MLITMGILLGAAWRMTTSKSDTRDENLPRAGDHAKSTAPGFDNSRSQRNGLDRSASGSGGWFASELESLERESDDAKREELIALLVNDIAPAEIPEAINSLMRSSTEFAREICVQLARRWAEADSRSAADWANRLPPGGMRDAALNQAVVAWADGSWTEAAAWARQLPNKADRDHALQNIAEEVLRNAPVEAVQLATELQSSPQRDELLRHAGAEWASREPIKAVQWAGDIGDEQLREQILSGVALSWSENDPVSAANLVLKEIRFGRLQSDAIIGILERWAQSSPEQAAAWVEAFPASDLRETAVSDVAQLWMISDPEKADRWRSKMAMGISEVKDAAP